MKDRTGEIFTEEEIEAIKKHEFEDPETVIYTEQDEYEIFFYYLDKKKHLCVWCFQKNGSTPCGWTDGQPKWITELVLQLLARVRLLELKCSIKE